jgi:hypothetical protein
LLLRLAARRATADPAGLRDFERLAKLQLSLGSPLRPSPQSRAHPRTVARHMRKRPPGAAGHGKAAMRKREMMHSRGDRNVRWIETCCGVPSGACRGEPARLTQLQQETMSVQRNKAGLLPHLF